MPGFQKYNIFAEDRAKGTHILWGTTHTLKIALSNTAPNVTTHTVRADITELATGGGYTSGGEDVQNDGTRTGATVYVTGVDVVWTPSGGGFGPFRYIILYNDTPAGDPLIGYWDFGSSISTGAVPFTWDVGTYLLTIT